jgi:hypothetical protein
MSLLGTVSQSVANTVKRSLLIFATIMYFGNPITYLNVAGIAMVSIGDPRLATRAERQRQLTARLRVQGYLSTTICGSTSLRRPCTTRGGGISPRWLPRCQG